MNDWKCILIGAIVGVGLIGYAYLISKRNDERLNKESEDFVNSVEMWSIYTAQKNAKRLLREVSELKVKLIQDRQSSANITEEEYIERITKLNALRDKLNSQLRAADKKYEDVLSRTVGKVKVK